MILVNGQKATLRQFNRTTDTSYFDDQNYNDITIKVVPYGVDEAIRFGIYTHPEAKGYYMVNRNIDAREGDQIIFEGKYQNTDIDLVDTKFTILEVKDNWCFNHLSNKILVVK